MKNVNFYCGKVNSQGGSKISLLNLILLIHEEQKPQNIFVSNKGWFTTQLEKSGIKYFVIKEPYFIRKIKKETNTIFKILFLIFSLPRLIFNWTVICRRIKKDEKIVLNEIRDLVLFFPFFFKNKNIKILWVRSENVSKATKYFLKKADRIVAVSDIVKNNVEYKTNRSVDRIYNFMVKKPRYKEEKNIDGLINIAVVGSIQYIKGQLDALKVLNELKDKMDLRLYIIGREFNVSYVNQMKNYIKENNLERRVELIGHIEGITDFLDERMHITLVPSQTESFCRVAMESVSVGVPVIAYNVGGLKEVVINGKTGLLVGKNDIYKMKEAVLKLTSDNKYYYEIRNNCIKDWRERFSRESIKDQVTNLLY